MKRNWFAAVLSVMLALPAAAQEFNVPVGYILKAEQDYKTHEANIIKCIKWLQSTPVNQQVSKRKDAIRFLNTWINGCPYVKVIIDRGVIKFADVNPELLIIYMGGWVLDALESGTDGKDVVKGTTAGLKSVAAFYEANKEFLNKDKEVEKIKSMDEKGKLQAWVEKRAAKMTPPR